jgi:hypothetical protein
MTDSAGRATLRTGRPLDPDGDPTDGPALALDPGGPAADLLRTSPRALVSSPGAGTWATLLARPGEAVPAPLAETSAGEPGGGGSGSSGVGPASDRPGLLQWLAPDASAPPPHTHPTTETFRVVEGRLTVVCDSESRRLDPGESVTVPAGVEHAFRNDTSETVAFVARLPSMRTVRALYSVWGMDHEGVFGDGPPGDPGRYGEPGPLRGLLLAESLRGETIMTAAPAAVQRALWATVGRLARVAGYRAVEERYLADDFWERRVEQSSL